MKRLSLFWVVAVSVFVIDQFTKSFALAYLKEKSLDLLPFFSFTYVENTGISFGLLKGSQTWVILFSVIVVGIIFFYHKQLLEEKDPLYLPAALILGGTIGNLIDRIMLGHVIDFLDFKVWPVFNVADSAICVGTVWLILLLWKKDEKEGGA
ncbi:signal peptidase II [Candidatus Woesearchaeota archaeon]|nr:signal peptidase II [Candidatus Woesearchaeota archaeon]